MERLGIRSKRGKQLTNKQAKGIIGNESFKNILYEVFNKKDSEIKKDFKSKRAIRQFVKEEIRTVGVLKKLLAYKETRTKRNKN